MRQQAPNLEKRIARTATSAANGLGRLEQWQGNRRIPARHRPKRMRGNGTSAYWRGKESSMTNAEKNLFAVIVTAMICAICLLGLVI